MKANRRFFVISFILNMILGLAGGGIFWAVWAIGASTATKWVVEMIVCSLIFATVAVYVNMFIVKRSKLKTVYSIYGIAVNLVFYAFVAAVLPFLLGFTLVF